jgi:hypothetical protein
MEDGSAMKRAKSKRLHHLQRKQTTIRGEQDNQMADGFFSSFGDIVEEDPDSLLASPMHPQSSFQNNDTVNTFDTTQDSEGFGQKVAGEMPCMWT